MAETELDTFLGGAGETAPDAGEELLGVPSEPDKPEAEAPPEAAPKPEGEDDDEAEPTGTIAALQHERNKRRDWKEKAVRAETERDELRRQLEEAKRAAAAPPPQPQYQPPPSQPQYIPDPAQDPQGFVQWQQDQLLNERLNFSQIQAQREFGADAVEIAAEEFRAAMAKDKSLKLQLAQQLHPYEFVLNYVQKDKPEGWLQQQAELAQMKREIATDPAAYRAKLRAQIEAEMQATQPAAPAPVSPAARLAPSLANARSAAPRASGAWAGPTPMTELFPPR